MPSGSDTLNIEEVITPESLGTAIATNYQEWDIFRAPKKETWKEVYKYVYATDTRNTSNNALPWKNTTTTPKLTQIRDNLWANYIASLFPKRRWLKWEADERDDQVLEKSEAIRAYMEHVVNYEGFRPTFEKLVLDYIDFGNAFAMVEWKDERIERENNLVSGYVGPTIKRISPYDIVFNPTATDFYSSPKIVRSLISLGEVKELQQRLSLDDDERVVADELYDYLVEIRQKVSSYTGHLQVQNELYQIDGFGSFQQYLGSGYAEILTFYGDYYDVWEDKFYKNHIIQVIDRHRVLSIRPNPRQTGGSGIHHVGWRPRQDNLWAMGPLENLVGLQYRIDHIENNKADFFDLVNFPPLKVRGYVEDFEWGPFEKIYVGDEGDVEVLTPNVNPLQANFEIDALQNRMEELAGAPREAMGFRTPGEKTAYEVQRLENAAGRIFAMKTVQFESQFLERLLNSALEMAVRRMDPTTVRVADEETSAVSFVQVTPEDVRGAGRIRPIAARHFAETAERVQNVTNFYSSAVGQDPNVKIHMSGIQTAKMFEELLDLREFNIVEPYIQITENAEAQMLANQSEEDTLMATETPSGLTPDDADEPFV